jgi:hypothetical protein
LSPLPKITPGVPEEFFISQYFSGKSQDSNLACNVASY